MLEIKVMHDWDCYPLWTEDGSNINPYLLPISDELTNSLFIWSNKMDRKLNRFYPPDSKINSIDYLIHNLCGLFLTNKLRKELPNYVVTYHLSIREIIVGTLF